MRNSKLAQAMRAAVVVAAAGVLLLLADATLFGAAEVGLHALKRQYWRPAAIPYPKENPYGRTKEELGRALFFDPILSGARVRSCATCHNPGLSWGDGEPRAIGENQVRLPIAQPDAAPSPGYRNWAGMGTSAIWKASLWGRSPARPI